jgi:hypothetical protein
MKIAYIVFIHYHDISPYVCIIIYVLFTTWAAVLYRIYIQTRAEGESLYIWYTNTDANVVNDLKNDSSYEFIGEVILKINVV